MTSSTFFWSATPCASPPPRLSIFLIIFWGVHHLTNRDDRHLLAHAMVSNWFFITDQTPCPYPPSFDTGARNGVLCGSRQCQFTEENGLAEVWTWVSQMTHRCSIHYSTSSCSDVIKVLNVFWWRHQCFKYVQMTSSVFKMCSDDVISVCDVAKSRV
jgi:hypothetical protein